MYIFVHRRCTFLTAIQALNEGGFFMEIKVHDAGEEWDVVLLDDGESLSWAFPDSKKAKAFAADLEAVLRKHDQR